MLARNLLGANDCHFVDEGMPISITTNIASLSAQRSIARASDDLSEAYTRLSSGKRVSAASDDVVGLSVGSKLQARISGLNQSVRNVNDAISMVQIAEGAYGEATTILQRMRDLAVQAANGSLSSTERGHLDAEHRKLSDSLGRVMDEARFGARDLINDAVDTQFSIQSGPDENDQIEITFAGLSPKLLEVDELLINLAGSGVPLAEKVAFESFAVYGATASRQHIPECDNKLASGGTGYYTITFDSTDYSTPVMSPPSSVTALATALNDIADLSALGTFAEDNNTLRFTARAGGTISQLRINSFDFDLQLHDGFGNESSKGFNVDTFGTNGTTNIGDVYTLTVGGNSYSTSAATSTADYNTNKEIATALQDILTTEGVTQFTIATADDRENGTILLSYAGNGDRQTTTYKIEKTVGTVGADDLAGVITDGVSDASDAINYISGALDTISTERAKLGATQKQLMSTVRNLLNIAENTSAARARILDVDYASETAKLTKAQILQQAATSILAQANAQPEIVLDLLD